MNDHVFLLVFVISYGFDISANRSKREEFSADLFDYVFHFADYRHYKVIV